MLAAAPVARKFADVEPADFKEKIGEVWEATSALRATVESLVEQELILPVQGVAILACATGQLLGYREFHGQTSPSDIVALFAGYGG